MYWGQKIWGSFSLNGFSYLGISSMFFFLLFPYAGSSQVGINTSDPQEKLHIAGTTGTLRVESLNAANNPFNSGDTDGNGNMDDNTVPLYVDEHGDFKLQLEVLENSGAEDYLIPYVNQTLTLSTNNTSGCIDKLIETYVFPPISRPTLLQVKYNISHKIYLDNQNNSLADGLARRVDNFIRITPDPDPTDGITDREYGPSSRTYTSASANSVQGPFFNGHTTYVRLIPAPNTTENYTLELWGRVCSDLNSSGGSLQTRVFFTYDADFLFLKLH